MSAPPITGVRRDAPRLAFATSLAAQPESNYRCRFVARPEPERAEQFAGVTCSGDERYDDRTAAPEARR